MIQGHYRAARVAGEDEVAQKRSQADTTKAEAGLATLRCVGLGQGSTQSLEI